MTSTLRIGLLSLLLLIWPVSVSGQEVGRPQDNTPKVLIVLDTSGSMRNGNKLRFAAEWAIANAIAVPTDGLNIGLITFSSTHTRLLDTRDPDKSSEWFELPSKPVLDFLSHYLRTLGPSGSTNPDSALEAAMKSGAQTVVIITDGGFDSNANPKKVLEDLRVWAEKHKRGLPMFMVMGVHPNLVEQKKLKELADESGGQFWYQEAPAAEEPR